MEKINPTLYITDWDPTDEPTMNASEWFETETMELTLKGQEVDNEDRSTLIWYAAQGWKTKKEVAIKKKWRGGWFGIYEDGKLVYSTGSSTGATSSTWKYFTRFELERRVIKSEKTLNSLIESYTKAYNEGRELNDQRYDDIIALFNVTLDKTEDELNAINATNTAHKTLIESIIAKIETDCTTFTADTDGLFNNFGSSQLTRIEQAFANKLSALRQDLINRGMYSSTLWVSASAGIEREKALAISDFEDKKLTQKMTLEQNRLSARNNMRDRMLAAYDRLNSKLENSIDKNLTVRNSIITALTNFMERRNDTYPDMDSIAKLVSNLGMSTESAPTSS